MPWFRLDDKFHGNPKVMLAGNAAVGLYVRCGTYCADHLTDGKVPKNLAKTYGRLGEIRALLSVGLWVENGDDYVMPDYLDYNPSRLQVEAEREAARVRMSARRSGDVRANADRSFGGSSETPTRPDPLVVEKDNNSESFPEAPSSSPSFAAQVATAAAELLCARSSGIENPPAWVTSVAKKLYVDREDRIRQAHARGLSVTAAAEFVLTDPVTDAPKVSDLESARVYGASAKQQHLEGEYADLTAINRDAFVSELKARDADEAWHNEALRAYDDFQPTPKPALRVV